MVRKAIFSSVILLISLVQSAFCTHYFDYYVYVEDYYTQGRWKSAGLTDSSGGKYLIPKHYNDLFGTIDIDVYSAILKRLTQEKPNLYVGTSLITKYNERENWETLSVRIGAKTEEEFETIKNGVVFSFSDYGHNEYTSFQFADPNLQQKFGGKVFSRRDVTIPVFSLTTPLQKQPDIENLVPETLKSKPTQGESPLPQVTPASTKRGEAPEWLTGIGTIFLAVVAFLLAFYQS